jgi:L-alanine-DL-glutamate epimerase-like enolase superfamily enzyme
MAAAQLIERRLRPVIEGTDAMALAAAWDAMVAAFRNVGRPGIAASAISAVDVALWDLKAHLLELPLVQLLGAAREAVPVYASGGFTSYSSDELAEQLARWVAAGIPRVKMTPTSRPRSRSGNADAVFTSR